MKDSRRAVLRLLFIQHADFRAGISQALVIIPFIPRPSGSSPSCVGLETEPDRGGILTVANNGDK